MSNLIGFNKSLAETTLTSGKSFSVGDRTSDSDGNTFVYVYTSAALSKGDCVAVKYNYNVAPMTDALSKTAMEVAFASTVAVAINSYTWLQSSGNLAALRVAVDCDIGLPLYITGTAGTLDDATLSSMIRGVYLVASAATTSVYAGVATFPHVVWGASLSEI